MTSSILETGYRKFEYLDLALHFNVKQIVTEDKIQHTCYFKPSQFKHHLHSENKHLNSLSDLFLSLSTSLQVHQDHLFRKLEDVLSSLVGYNQILKDIQNNLVYLKESQDLLNQRFSVLRLESLPTRQDLTSLSKLIEDNKPKEVALQSKALLLELKSLAISNKIQIEKDIATLTSILEELKYK